MGVAVMVAAVAVLVAVVATVVADRSRRAAEARATTAEERMHVAQAMHGELTVRVEELEEAIAAGVARAAEVAAASADLVNADPETGLLGEAYFDITLESRVAAAKRHLRPVAVVLVEIADPEGGAVDVPAVAAQLIGTLRAADIACRIGDDGCCFGILLEDTPENGAVWSVERFRRAMASSARTTILRAGIACYPAHAFDAAELRVRAGEALDAARQWRQDRIEVATASEV
jgi:diguanylate cyclase (GGDEF)-like protein